MNQVLCPNFANHNLFHHNNNIGRILSCFYLQPTLTFMSSQQQQQIFVSQMSSELSTIFAAFQSHGLSEIDRVSKQTLFDVITRMNANQQFDENVFNEIWEECEEDSIGKVQIREFVDVIYRARHILSNRTAESTRKLEELIQIQNTLQRRYTSEKDYEVKQGLGGEISQLKEQIKNLKQTISDSAIDLQILNKPFFRPGSYRQSVFASPLGTDIKSYMPDVLVPQQPLQLDLPAKAKAQQRLLMAFTIFGMLLQIMIIYSKIGFLNLVSYSLIFVFYLLPKVPKHFWVVALSLLAASIPLDIAWLTLYSRHWWWNGMEHINSVGFQRYCVVMTSIILLFKAYACVLLFFGFKPTSINLPSIASKFI